MVSRSNTHKKENVDLLLRLRFGGIAKHLNNHIRVKAHAIGVSIRAFTLGCFFDFGEISETRI